MLREHKCADRHYFVDEHGQRQGEYESWHINRQQWETAFYVNDKLHGEYNRYHLSGQLAENFFFVNDKMHGEFKKWDINGELISHCFYVNDKYVSFDKLPYPTTPEEKLYFILKYNIRLLPTENVC